MAQISKVESGHHHIQERGWGYEIWYENLPEYCGKKLVVKEGKKGSLHFHKNKTETMLLLRGKADLRMIDTDSGKEYVVTLTPGDTILIPPLHLHQIIAFEESEIIEFSTTHEETDSYRVQKGD